MSRRSITATAPIVAERAMYLSRPGQPFGAGHESAGVTAPALEWFLAEGATGAFFDLFVLIANPGATDAAVSVEYLLVGGGSLTKTYTVPANSRTTIWVDDEQLPAGSGQKPLANVAVSTTVRSTNSVPIIVERAMWWPGPALTANYWYEAHNSPGATTTATRWITGGGEAGGAGRRRDLRADRQYDDDARAGPGDAAVRLGAGGRGGTTTCPRRAAPTCPSAMTSPRRIGALRDRRRVAGRAAGADRGRAGDLCSPGGVTWASGGNALASPLP